MKINYILLQFLFNTNLEKNSLLQNCIRYLYTSAKNYCLKIKVAKKCAKVNKKLSICQNNNKKVQMQGLSLSNFKSYRKQNIFGFNSHVNIIIGGNGQGKSNIFKALSFVLSDRLQLNRTEFYNCVHRGIDVSEDRQVEVQVVFREKSSTNQYMKIAKVWKPNLTQECYINSKITNKKQYENLIDSLSLSYTNPYNIIQQGRINQITLMDEFELYKLLQQVTGVRKFNKRKQEALALLKKVDIQKQQTRVVLNQLNDKLKTLENRKEEFEFFAVEEKTKKYRNKKHLSELLEGTKHNLEKIKNQYDELSDNLAKIIYKKKIIQQNLEEGALVIRTQKQKLMLVNKSQMIETQTAETQQIKDLQKRQKQLHKQLKEHAKAIRQKDKFAEQFKKTYHEIEQNYESIKLNKQLSKPKQSKQKIIDAFESQIKYQQQKLREMKSESEKLDKKIQEVEKLLKQKKNMEAQTQSQKLQLQLTKLKYQLDENKKLLSQYNWQRNVLTIQSESLKEILNQIQTKIRKSLPNLDFHLLEYLKNNNVRGVYGYFVEFVKVDESVAFAYEMAGMNKLCSILVEDQDACIAVIEANKKLKGRQINIIQLDYIRSKPAESQTIPKSQNVKKLSNPKWIKLNTSLLRQFPESLSTDVEKLIKNTFQKYALVKDYETGLKISKQYHVNCITSDREVIYSQGYHCKLGQESSYQDNHLQTIERYQEKRQQFYEKNIEKRELQNKILEAENREIQLINQQHKIEIQINKFQNTVTQLKTQRKMLEAYLKNREQIDRNYKENEASLKKKKQTVGLLASNNSKSKPVIKFSKEQSEKIESLYIQKRKEWNKILTQIYEIQEILQKLSSQKAEIDEKIIKAKNNKSVGIINPEAYANDIERKIQEHQKQIRAQQKQIQQLQKIQKQVENNKNHVEVKLITYRAEEEDIQSKLAEIGEIDENIQELEQLSNSMSVSHLHGKRRNQHYSAKDKILFTKFSNILESFSLHKKTFKQLEQSEQKIKRLISKYENESEQYMGKIAEKFEKQFVDIFKFIVHQGGAQVRFKKVSQKVKDAIKYKNCLTIKVTFSNSSQAMKKFSDFSGGEKTVIAISMIIALQRCEPAPFYILDEVDSALDPIFVQKIVQLLARQSQRNNSQYFISSFKEDMMGFPEEICNYYLVHNENRESSIQKIRQNKALDALRSIVMRR